MIRLFAIALLVLLILALDASAGVFRNRTVVRGTQAVACAPAAPTKAPATPAATTSGACTAGSCAGTTTVRNRFFFKSR